MSGQGIGIWLSGGEEVGRTSLAIALTRFYQGNGCKVLNLQFQKGYSNVNPYLMNGCRHHSIPIEAVKGLDHFEKWIPAGYDVYIIEGGHPERPQWIISSMLNEIIPDELQNYVLSLQQYPRSVPLVPTVTMTPKPIKGVASFTTRKTLHHLEKMAAFPISPKLQYPDEKKTALGIGLIPGEYCDLFKMDYCGFNYDRFISAHANHSYDYLVIGMVHDDFIPYLRIRLAGEKVICYYPPLFIDGCSQTPFDGSPPDPKTAARLREILLDEPIGTPLPPGDFFYQRYNNKFWAHSCFLEVPPVEQRNEITICGAWVHPMTLIGNGYITA